MNVLPYIGITDFTSFEQVENMQKVFLANKPPDSKRILHIGVMMSFKTLYGIETKWSKAFPPKESIAGIFSSKDVYNCLHYADYDSVNNFEDNICEALSFAGPNVRAIQLDMVWPEPIDLALGYLASGKDIEIILQVGKNALLEVGNDPKAVVERLENYEDLIDRVLLDKSMRKGVGMDAEGLLPFARAIKERFPNLGIGFAGGLGPETLHLVKPILKEFPDASIDAQDKLRPSGNALDPVDSNMAGEYLAKALKLLG